MITTVNNTGVVYMIQCFGNSPESIFCNLQDFPKIMPSLNKKEFKVYEFRSASPKGKQVSRRNMNQRFYQCFIDCKI